MIALPSTEAPRSPGQLLKDALQGSGDAQDLHAVRLGISRRRLNEILNERRSVTADSALRLARYLGTAPEFWLESQTAHDLAEARRDRKLMKEIESIVPLRSAGARQHGVLRLVGAADAGDATAVAEAPRRESEADAALRREVELLRAAVARQGRELREAAMLREFLRGKGLLREAERYARVKSSLQGMHPEEETAAPEA
ncbi:MAG TPA: HigA family addiction module antitoxin [Longimicrobiaceae bacterium]|nr:HigA family addiction module antitoxin [Longimicrobiaceae bacterium]